MLITHDTVKKGERVLVLGASGGVGTGCVLLAKMLGAEVIACASSEEKLARLKAMGADEVVDYTKTDWSKWAVEKYGKPQRRSYDGGVDVVVNFTGGDTWVPSLRCLKRGGKLLVCGATAGYDPKEDLRYVWSFEIKIIGSNSFYDDDLKGLMDLIGAGRIKPVIDKVLPLDHAREGLRLIQDREVIGKVVVTP
jgi:NADPH:quinone reductase-like Zn-dependent oxidoreductase